MPTSLEETRLRSFDACPRRFFYTHVLGLGSAKKATAFSRTHDCLYDLIGWLAAARLHAQPSLEEAEAAFEEIWARRGPTEHGYARDYRALASRLIATLVEAGSGRAFREAQPVELPLRNGRVVVVPDEVFEVPDGSVVIRRVRTGYRRSKEYEEHIEYAVFLMAADAGSRRAEVRALHLTDGREDRVEMKPTMYANRKARIEAMLADIGAGWFRPEVDAFTCPRCPHFFICAAMPSGALTLD